MLCEVPEFAGFLPVKMCLGMLSLPVDRNSVEEESRCAIVVDPNFVLPVTFRITSGCRGSLWCGASAWLLINSHVCRPTR
jgi:hypothetical protein